MSRAPYSTRKPKKVESEEPPTVTVTDPAVDTPTRIRAEPSIGGIVREDKELSSVHLEEVHEFTHLLATRPSHKLETPIIHGRRVTAYVEGERVTAEPTAAKITDRREVTIGRWANIPLTTNIDSAVENRPQATGFKLLPKDKNIDVEHTEEA